MFKYKILLILDAEEREYLAKLKQIRQQNYNERKALNQKFVEHKKAYKVSEKIKK